MATNPFASDPLELKVYPLMNDFVGNINLPDNHRTTKKVETVIILDRSGSMGMSVPKLVNSVLPKFFANLSYDEEKFFHLITFESQTVLHKIKINTLPNVQMVAGGGTCMAPAVKKLHDLFEEFKWKNVEAVRILTISDGEIDDKKLTKEYGDELAAFASQCNISVNSQAVRFFTSALSPDTTAICSLLQLNNIQKSNLTDITASEDDDIIAEKMAKLFLTDGIDKMKTMENPDQIFYKNPWDEKPFEKLPIFPGQNTFWLRDVPKSSMKIDESSINIKKESKMSIVTFSELFETKINFIADRIKVLKVVNTQYSEKSVEKIVNYFKEIEEFFVKKSSEEKIDIRKFETFRTIREIAKDEKIGDMSNEQKAEYLRSASRSEMPKDEKTSLSYDELTGEYKMVVVPSNFPQDVITQQQCEAFNNYLEQEIDKIQGEDTLAPNFLNFSFESGYILFECQGLHSVEFLKQAVANYQFGQSLKVMSQEDLLKPIVFKTSTSEKKFSAENFLTRISRQNQGAGIDTSKWKVNDLTQTEGGSSFNVEMDLMSASTVRKTKSLFYGLSTVKFIENEINDTNENMSAEKMRLVGNADLYAKRVADQQGKSFDM